MNASACVGKTSTGAIRLGPNSSDVYVGVGTALQFSGHVDEAITKFRKAVELKPDSVEAHIALGEALTSTWRPDRDSAAAEGASECKVAIGLQPDSPEAHECLGMALSTGADLLYGPTDEIIAEYRKAIDLDPYSANAHYFLGSMLTFPAKIIPEHKENLDEAISEFKKAIEFSCDYPAAREELAQAVALKECKDTETCSLLIKQFLKEDIEKRTSR